MIIATYTPPKQRATIHYGCRLIENHLTPDEEERFCAERFEVSTGDCLSSGPFVSAELAWAAFHADIQLNSTFGPKTWED